MNQDNVDGRRPLPGLVKLYLLQLYPLAGLLLVSRFFLTALGLEGGPEPLFWSVACLVYGLACATVIAGLHSRATWAPGWSARLNFSLALLCAVGALRLGAALGRSGLWRFGLYEGTLMLPLLPAILAMHIPVFLAWRIYFARSPGLAEAFATQPDAAGKPLPPVGLGILRTASAAYLLYYLVFFSQALLAGVGKSTEAGLAAAILLLDSLPAIIFFLYFACVTISPGRRQKSIVAPLFALSFVMLCCTHLPWLLPMLLNEAGYGLYNLLSKFSQFPVPRLLLAFFAAMLAWKIQADPAERAWFADGRAPGNKPAALTVFNVALLYLAVNILAEGLGFLVSTPRVTAQADSYPPVSPAVAGAVLTGVASLAIALNGLAIYKRNRPPRSDKTLSLLSVLSGALLGLAGLVPILINLFASNSEPGYITYQIIRLSRYLPPLAASIVGLLYWRARYGGEERRGGLCPPDTPRLGFGLFCLIMIVLEVGQKLLNTVASTFADEDYLTGYFARQGDIVNGLLYNPEFWLAYLLCPLLALKWLKTLPEKLPRFYALCVVWLCSLVSSVINLIVSIIVGYSHAQGPLLFLNQALDPMKQVYFYAILLFMIYLATAYPKGAPRPGDRPE